MNNRNNKGGFATVLLVLLVGAVVSLVSMGVFSYSSYHNRVQTGVQNYNEAFYAGELAAWNGYHKHKLDTLTAESQVSELVNLSSLNGGTIPYQMPTQTSYSSDTYTAGTPLDVATTSLYDSAQTILNRYETSMLKYSIAAENSKSVYSGQMRYSESQNYQVRILSPICGGYVQLPPLTKIKPRIHIQTRTDLEAVTSNNYYVLDNDLNLGVTSFTPLGNGVSLDSVIFDGQGHTITGFIVNPAGPTALLRVGLFSGLRNSVVMNLRVDLDISSTAVKDTVGNAVSVGGLVGCLQENSCIENSSSGSSVIGKNIVGGLVGRASLTSGSGHIVISNSTSSASVHGESPTGFTNATVGGLVGFTNGLGSYQVYVLNSSATGPVSADDTGLGGGSAHAGGLIGGIYDLSEVRHSSATGSVTTTGESSSAGGLAGEISGSVVTPTIVADTFATGNVTATGSGPWGGLTYAGGFIGTSLGKHIIRNCYAQGTVTAIGTGNRAAGFLASFCDYSAPAEIIHSYSYGVVSGWAKGGFVSHNPVSNGGTATSCYWDTQTSGQATSALGTGKTTAEMQNVATFVDWDFVNTWKINLGDYPRLR